MTYGHITAFLTKLIAFFLLIGVVTVIVIGDLNKWSRLSEDSTEEIQRGTGEQYVETVKKTAFMINSTDLLPIQTRNNEYYVRFLCNGERINSVELLSSSGAPLDVFTNVTKIDDYYHIIIRYESERLMVIIDARIAYVSEIEINSETEQINSYVITGVATTYYSIRV